MSDYNEQSGIVIIMQAFLLYHHKINKINKSHCIVDDVVAGLFMWKWERLNNGILKILINGRRRWQSICVYIYIAQQITHHVIHHHNVNAYACLIERFPSGKYGYRSGCAKKEQKVYAINTMLTCNYINGWYFTNLCNIRCTRMCASYQTWQRIKKIIKKNFLAFLFLFILKKVFRIKSFFFFFNLRGWILFWFFQNFKNYFLIVLISLEFLKKVDY